MTESRTTTQDGSPVNCHSFQASLPELFETDVSLHDQPHLTTCTVCSSLVHDLEYIAAQAKLLLPIHEPSPAVWENIQSALAKPGSRSKR